MTVVNIEPEEEIQERTLGGTIALRIAATLLGAFIGFSCYVGANLGLFIIDEQYVDEDYVLGRFSLSILIWTIIGLVTPFRRIARFFEILIDLLRGSNESGKAVSYGRLLVAIIVLSLLLLVYYYALGILASIINSIFE